MKKTNLIIRKFLPLAVLAAAVLMIFSCGKAPRICFLPPTTPWVSSPNSADYPAVPSIAFSAKLTPCRLPTIVTLRKNKKSHFIDKTELAIPWQALFFYAVPQPGKQVLQN